MKQICHSGCPTGAGIGRGAALRSKPTSRHSSAASSDTVQGSTPPDGKRRKEDEARQGLLGLGLWPGSEQRKNEKKKQNVHCENQDDAVDPGYGKDERILPCILVAAPLRRPFPVSKLQGPGWPHDARAAAGPMIPEHLLRHAASLSKDEHDVRSYTRPLGASHSHR